MAVNFDMDVGEYIKSLLGKKSAAKDNAKEDNSLAKQHYKQAGVKAIIIICITAIIGFGINYFTKAATEKETSDFTNNQDLSDAVVKIEQDITTSTAMLDKNRKKVAEILPMFSDKEGSKSLFKLISNLAAQNNLIINNLSQGETIENTNPAKYQETKILLDMEGYYGNYISFIKALNDQKPLLRVDSENTKLVTTKNGERKLQIKLNLVDYAIQKDEYEKILSK